MKLRTLSTFVLLALAGLRAAPGAIVTTDLPVGTTKPFATSINTSGHVAGYCEVEVNGNSFLRSWLWMPGAAPVTLTPTLTTSLLFLADDDRVTCGTFVSAAEGTQATFSWKEGDANAGYTTVANPSGGNYGSPVGMNAAGRVICTYVDTATNPASTKGYSWTKAGGVKLLTPAGAFSSYPKAVSAGGTIAGWYASASDEPAQPCVWTGAASTFAALAVPLGAKGGLAVAVSDAKGAVGQFTDAGGAFHACSWSGAGFGTFKDLTPPPSAAAVSSWVQTIGSSGLAAGTYVRMENGKQIYNHCVWTSAAESGSFTAVSSEVAAEKVFVSAGGRFAGNTYYTYDPNSASNPTRAITWQAGVLTSLLPAGAVSSFARALGDDGTVAGEYVTTGGQTRAFAWKNGVARDITPAGATEAKATVVNATGTVGGHYVTADGTAHLFTATASDGSALTLISGKPAKPMAPTVAVTGKRKFVTTKSSARLKGTTTGSVTSVAVKIGKKTVKAAGTASWSAKLKLKPGKNKVAITATGPGGTSAPARVTITRQ